MIKKLDKKFRLILSLFFILSLVISDVSIYCEDLPAKIKPNKTTDVKKEDSSVAPSSPAPAEEENTKEAPKVKEEVAVPEASSGNVTMDFKDADINNVLRILSYKSGVNIVAGKDVQGLVTVRLTDVPWEKALEVVLKTYGFSYERDGNIIRVTSLKGLKEEELSTEAFSLNYAKAKDATEAVKDMISERGKARYDERTNVLIVTDIPTNIYKISQIVKKLDKKIPQVLIETKIIETELGDDENLGIDWSLKISAIGASRPTTFPFNAMMAPFGHAQSLKGYFPKSQSQTTTSQSPSGGAAANTTLFTSTDFPVANEAVFPFAQASNFTFGTLDFTQFSAVLELLKQRRNTNILSNPKIATLNNKPASITVGSILTTPLFERNPDTGTMEISGFKEYPLGIKLSVTPNINDERDIIVDLKPQLNDFLGYDIYDASRQIKAPRFATREAQTQVMVKSGQTIMIGGLIKEDDIDYKKKVPILGDIPGINWLFTKIEKSKKKTELIFFVTVNIIEDVQVNAPSVAYVPMKVGSNLPYKTADIKENAILEEKEIKKD